MSTRRPASIALAALVLGAALLPARADAGFTLKVTPIPIVITGGATSTMVELRNEGQSPVRVQASTYDWTQTATGEDRINPSAELLVFPSMISLAPGEARKVRVGTQGGYAAGEKPFRVLFSELPSNVSQPGEAEVVRVVAQVSVPIFVRPPGSAAAPKLTGLAATKDHVRFGIQNTGPAHALVEKIQVDFLGPGGKPKATKNVPGWYVLPGMTRPFDVELDAGACTGAEAVRITAVSTQSGTFTATLDKPACAS